MDKCVICDNEHTKNYSAEFVPFVKERMFDNRDDKTDVVYCPECHFYYSSNRPNEEQMTKFYEGYRDENYQKQREKYEPYYTEEFNHNLGFSKESEFVRKKIITDLTLRYLSTENISNILDYGGDAGQYIPDIYNKSNKFVYDISGVNTISGVFSIRNYEDLKSIKWDLIMCCHVLEHVSYPMQILNNIISIMPLNGYLYIEVPYEDYIEASIANKTDVPIHEHINFFRTETFEKIFSNYNFIILENKIVDIPNVEGQVFAKHIHCLVKKIDIKDNDCLLLKKIREQQIISNTVLIDIQNLKDSNQQLHVEIEKLNNEVAKIKGINQNSLNEIFVLNKMLSDYIHRPTFIQQIFSVKNEGNHKVVRIFGIKIKVRRKSKCQ